MVADNNGLPVSVLISLSVSKIFHKQCTDFIETLKNLLLDIHNQLINL